MVTRTPFVIPSRPDWFSLLILIGILGFIAQVLLTMGLQRETAGRATMAIYTQVTHTSTLARPNDSYILQIVFATIFQRIFFNTTPPWLSVIGTILILSSALYVAVSCKILLLSCFTKLLLVDEETKQEPHQVES